MKKKIFIIGISSNLGFYLSQYLPKNKYVISGSFNKNNNFKKNYFNLSHNASEKNILKVFKNKPDIVIHCAALTNIEHCENNLKETLEVNTKFPIKISKICKILGIKFIFISTDQLFGGRKDFYNEKDKAFPKNNYSKSKFIAERSIYKFNNKSLILRLSFVGRGMVEKKNLFDFVYKNLKNKKKIYGYDDIFFTPVSFDYFTNILIKFIENNYSGRFNIASNKAISKYQLCVQIAKRYNLDRNLIVKSKYENKSIKRPKNMSLDISKMCKKLNVSGKSFMQMKW